jgi:hypothetical protein
LQRVAYRVIVVDDCYEFAFSTGTHR